jgi:mersacidin/lichenicidin family type 2 lantibiotic
MKSDITRAWKNEAYRQSLSDEQLNALPANPAGNLNETDLNNVYGGGGYEGPYGVNEEGAAASSSSFAARQLVRQHSYGFTCDINIFSVNVLTKGAIGIDSLINVLSPNTQNCLNSD